MIGSSLILGAAIFVALQKRAPAPVKDTAEGSALLLDEEAGRGHDAPFSNDTDRSQLHDVQMRTFR